MNIPVQNCSSCAACANVCARNAISMRLDTEGFYRPVIDAEKCVECGACERVCPWSKDVLNPNGAETKPQTVAAYVKDETVRMQSSSGGIFTVLAENVIDCGGAVIGVAQTGPVSFEHIVVENKSDLAKLRGPKYVQAQVGFIYRTVRGLIKSGRKVLFSGTPCQVAGLYAYLGNAANAENLFTVEIVCYGIPSVKVFEKYIHDLEVSRNATFENVLFRDKSRGWNNYSLIYKFNDGNTYNVHHGKSNYMNLFLNRICQNKSCDECRYRKFPRIADITLGDFWGVSNYHPEMDDNKGTSVVLLNTTPGSMLFKSVADKVVQCDSKVENAIAGNPCIVSSTKAHPKRSEFLADLDKCTFDQLVKKYCPEPSPLMRLYYGIRCFLGNIKQKVF